MIESRMKTKWMTFMQADCIVRTRRRASSRNKFAPDSDILTASSGPKMTP